MRWMDNIKRDVNNCGLEEGDAQVRQGWRMLVQNRPSTEPRTGILAGQGRRKRCKILMNTSFHSRNRTVVSNFTSQ